MISCSVIKTNSDNSNVKKAMIYYYLPQSNLTMNVKTTYGCNKDNDNNISKCIPVKLETEINENRIADTKNLYTIKYKPNILMDDDLNYFVNKKGLLDSLRIITDDKSKQISINSIKATSLIQFYNKGESVVPISADFITTTNNSFNFLATDLINKKLLLINFNDIIKNDNTSIKGSIIMPVRLEVSLVEENKSTSVVSKSDVKKDIDSNGIFTRPIKNILIKTKGIINGENFEKNDYQTIIDESKLIILPVERTLFAKQKNVMKFDDGLISYVGIRKPSSAEGFVEIPINIAKSIFGIPSELVKIRIDNSKKKIDAEESLKESQKKLDEIIQKLNN